jgi:hypothetical protein
MGHTIQGLIVPTTVAMSISVQQALRIPLSAAALAFIPMTDALFDRLVELFPSDTGHEHPEFWKLSQSGTVWVEELSATGRVGYIETDYFGGVGEQAAAVWEGGRTILGPRKGESGPINDALRFLGVRRTLSEDEFVVAGLDRHRRMDDWADD